ncbi:MAG: hypothetical protein LC754_10610, partial [Acidobacteria bacterium]|nr:hypothetical protein [Acidobacteriota bacterium]
QLNARYIKDALEHRPEPNSQAVLQWNGSQEALFVEYHLIMPAHSPRDYNGKEKSIGWKAWTELMEVK